MEKYSAVFSHYGHPVKLVSLPNRGLMCSDFIRPSYARSTRRVGLVPIKIALLHALATYLPNNENTTQLLLRYRQAPLEKSPAPRLLKSTVFERHRYLTTPDPMVERVREGFRTGLQMQVVRCISMMKCDPGLPNAGL